MKRRRARGAERGVGVPASDEPGGVQGSPPFKKNAWSHLRLRDRIGPGLQVLFVGINPGVRSAMTGHHFAGYSNSFWKLLGESGLAPGAVNHLDDDRFPEWGFGVTNLVARPSPGIGDLSRREYVEGWKTLDRKIRRYRPRVLALVGVTLYRALLPLIERDPGTRRVRARGSAIGEQPYIVHGARVFVLPNPSGRNAHFSYAEMLEAFAGLRNYLAAGQR